MVRSFTCMLLLVLAAALPVPAADWSFTAAADMRRYVVWDGIHGWDQACQAIDAAGRGAFLVSPGDLDQQYTSNPGDWVHQVLVAEIGPDYPFFPGVGNHEADDADTMDWLRTFDNGGPAYDVNPGPPGCANTTYSWDHGNAHFVMLNLCWDGTDDLGAVEGDWHAGLEDWLEADLTATDKPLIFVSGHFPAFPQPDRDTGLSLHANDTDFNTIDGGARRDAFWDVLVRHGVTAYICGHSHVNSAVEIDGVWQLDVAHARGPRDPNWHGPSTFLRFLVGDDESVVLETWRQPFSTGAGNEQPYAVWHVDTLRTARAVPVETPPPGRIVEAWPNPFNPSVTMTLDWEVGLVVEVDVVDLRGARIARLWNGTLPGGRAELRWDGRDDAGTEAPAGTYLFTAGDGRNRLSKRVTLVR